MDVEAGTVCRKELWGSALEEAGKAEAGDVVADGPEAPVQFAGDLVLAFAALEHGQNLRAQSGRVACEGFE